MARGSSWMKQKMAKLAAERRAKFNPETTVRRPGHTIEASNAKMAEVAELVASYGGVVTLCEPGRDLVRQGKGKRQFDAPATLDQYMGGGRKYESAKAQRTHLAAHARADMWATDTVLIRNGAVVK